jgi:hypothetical protein
MHTDYRVTNISGPIEVQIIAEQPTAEPTAVLSFASPDGKHSLRLFAPKPLSSLLAMFDNCYEIRLSDRNTAERNQLEFGRYQLQIWDEDNPIGEANVDDFEIVT